MKYQILHRYTGAVIAESDTLTVRELAEKFKANLSGANLRYANLSDADLRYANLSGANLRYANLSDADLSGAKNLKHAADYLARFEQDELGIIVYKRIANKSDKSTTEYVAPDSWVIKKGSFITENVNPLRTNECGCGVNFGTRDWCEQNYQKADLWKCRIRWIDLADVVVPFGTGGKARCARLELLHKVPNRKDQ